jgi:hypothetical protein
MSSAEVSNALGLSALKKRAWSIFKTSAKKGEGLDEAMEWWVCLHTGAGWPHAHRKLAEDFSRTHSSHAIPNPPSTQAGRGPPGQAIGAVQSDEATFLDDISFSVHP